MPRALGWVLAGAIGLGLSLDAAAQENGLDELLGLEPDALAAVIAADIERVRQLPFRERIAFSHQSPENFGRYVDAEVERTFPPARAAAFGRMVEKLGLYRGPRIEDVAALIRLLATSQAAAYYDPAASEFRVVYDDMPKAMLAQVFAHELYHGLQDQYWDLDAWLLDGMDRGLNDDELFARQAVVEGEASYVENWWALERLTGRPPSRLALGFTSWTQVVMSPDIMNLIFESGFAAEALGEDFQAAIDAMDDIPPFMLESTYAVYSRGMAFVHRIAAQGWDAVASLYTDPPRSSEQILHPEKYLNRDDPVAIEFPALASEVALEDWTVLDSNVVGEFQWRLIFDEFGFGIRGAVAAAGWDGDRFAVLERGDRLLLMLLTIWDSPAEAQEFATAYTELLGQKYTDVEEPWTLDIRGNEVLIVEGGERERQTEYLDVITRASRRE